MTGKEASLTWIIPGLMSITLGFVSWMAINTSRISESLAVIAFRIDEQASDIKDVQKRVRELEFLAALSKPRRGPQ